MAYIISSDCMDCGVCEYMCPESAIFEAKNQFVIRKDRCNGCGECVPYCPARSDSSAATASRQGRGAPCIACSAQHWGRPSAAQAAYRHGGPA